MWSPARIYVYRIWIFPVINGLSAGKSHRNALTLFDNLDTHTQQLVSLVLGENFQNTIQKELLLLEHPSKKTFHRVNTTRHNR